MIEVGDKLTFEGHYKQRHPRTWRFLSRFKPFRYVRNGHRLFFTKELEVWTVTEVRHGNVSLKPDSGWYPVNTL